MWRDFIVAYAGLQTKVPPSLIRNGAIAKLRFDARTDIHGSAMLDNGAHLLWTHEVSVIDRLATIEKPLLIHFHDRLLPEPAVECHPDIEVATDI